MRRRVALKVIKLGMDTRNVVARFEAERQALAMMDHPNIAKVFDAGATETGRPFFVMELVRGVRITDYCDQNHLSTEERLKLFVQVCHAIQHAHQKGVIHRDIKPSNILVMVVDDVPVPKVIDFGIAKAVGEPLTDKTTYTGFAQFIGTPAYMSPEQAGLGGLDVDTRSDIYGLGVLLYELLTGRTPFQSKTPGQRRRWTKCCGGCGRKRPPSLRRCSIGSSPRSRPRTSQLRATEPPRLMPVVARRSGLDCDEVPREEPGAALRHGQRPGSGHRVPSQPAAGERRGAHAAVSGHEVRSGAIAGCWRRRRRSPCCWLWGRRSACGSPAGRVRPRRNRPGSGRVRWALETALPAIERSLEQDDYAAAFKLVEQVRPYVAENPRFRALARRRPSGRSRSPPRRRVRRFSSGITATSTRSWDPIGKSPVRQFKVPQGFKRWQITLPGYETRGRHLVRPVQAR